MEADAVSAANVERQLDAGVNFPDSPEAIAVRAARLQIRGELPKFVADVFGSLPRRDQRRRGECYLRGLMLDGRRKSIQPQPLAERLPDGSMQALQQFVIQSAWDPLPVRRRIARRMFEAVAPEVWVIDDVSFPKSGQASVGGARQYCGAVGKRANCQVAVGVHAATDTARRGQGALADPARRHRWDRPGAAQCGAARRGVPRGGPLPHDDVHARVQLEVPAGGVGAVGRRKAPVSKGVRGTRPAQRDYSSPSFSHSAWTLGTQICSTV